MTDTKNPYPWHLPKREDWEMTVEYYLRYFNISKEYCNKQNTNIMIINRKNNRKILNIKDVAKKLALDTSRQIKVITFEELSIQKQMQEVYCTDIMIGVQGAGLTW